MREALAWRQRIMGFGHRVYTVSDPRTDILKPVVRRLAEHAGQENLFAICERIEQVMWREKQLFPNVDYYSARRTTAWAFPSRCSRRFSCWHGLPVGPRHIFEQRADNKLIRPTAFYVGPEPQPFLPADARDIDVDVSMVAGHEVQMR